MIVAAVLLALLLPVRILLALTRRRMRRLLGAQRPALEPPLHCSSG
ncbi:MAG TPA: hypothetical protein VKN99_25090 [Polyangia bacterium]|nr:hypothetical protein [Polyangia bacterium]